MGAFTFYKYPDLDARIGIAVDQMRGLGDGKMFALSFMSAGRSQVKRKGEVVGHTSRNPDKRAAGARLFAGEADDTLTFHAYRAGKAGNGVQRLPADDTRDSYTAADLHAAFKSGGNFRFDCWGYVRGLTADEIAESLGLVPTKNKPVTVTWP